MTTSSERRTASSWVIWCLLALACQRTPALVEPIRAVDPDPVALALDVPRMLADLTQLADDALAGRDSRDRVAIGMAAKLIADAYRETGLAPVGARYLVAFDLTVGQEPDDRHHLWLERNGDSIAIDEASFVSIAFGPHMVAMGDAIFVGGEPPRRGIEDRVAVLLAEPARGAGWTPDDLRTRLHALADSGALAAIVVGAADEPLPAAAPLAQALADAPIPAVFVVRDVASAFAIGGKPFDTAVAASTPSARPIDATKASLARRLRPRLEPVPNVLATIPGTDLADEIVVLGAHYDHIGTEAFGVLCRDPVGADDPDDSICNGADDNASGTAMVLAVARAMAAAGYRPRRSLVFAHFAGEELGLHGSRALLDVPPSAPPFARGRIVAMVNLDMVGRLRERGLEIGAVSTSEAWIPLIDRIRPPQLRVQYTPTVDSRSDHANFHRAGVPVLFFFTGLHEDYHRTSDESDRIDGEGMATIGALVLELVRLLGDGEAVPSASASRRATTRSARTLR
jgi:hypothetical protein